MNMNRYGKKKKGKKMGGKGFFLALLITLGGIGCEAQGQSNSSPRTVIGTIFTWATSFNTNYVWPRFNVWTGPAFVGSDTLNESGLSYDVWEQNTNDGGFFFAVENRNRLGTIAGTLASVNLGIELGYTHYDFRAYLFGDGVYSGSQPTSAGLLITKQDFGAEVGIGIAKMTGSRTAIGMNTSYQFAPSNRGGFVFMPQFTIQGNDTGFLGLGLF